MEELRPVFVVRFVAFRRLNNRVVKFEGCLRKRESG